MNKKKKIVLIVSLSILLVLGVVIGYSFAYFSAAVINGTPINETLVTTSALDIEFTDGPEVSLVNAIPGTSVEKQFKIENKTNLNTTYDVYMSEVVNEFVDKSDLVYTITSNDGGYNTTGEVQVPDENTKVIDAQLLRGNETHNYTLKVEFKEKFEIQDDNKDKEISFTIRVNEEREAERYKTVVDHITDLESTDDSIIPDETDDHNLRYIGSNPDNYVLYNDELWRIIGVMNNIETSSGNTKSLAKIMRYDYLGGYSWDTSSSDVNGGSGVNQWGESTYSDGTTYEGADLMRELNYDYLGDVQVGLDDYWFNGTSNRKTSNKPTSVLNSNSQNMIETAVWKLGTNGTTTYGDWTPTNMYTYERSTSNGKTCTSGSFCTDTVERTTSWTGKIGLFYPSDYGYATAGGTTTDRATCLNTSLSNWSMLGVKDCNDNDWFNKGPEWTMTPSSGTSADFVFFIDSGNLYGSQNMYYRAYTSYGVYPTLYLKSSVKITGGTGTQTDPYILSM